MTVFGISSFLILQAVVSVEAQNLELPALPYEYDALEPAIDEKTMRVHHLGHHQAYLNTINGVMSALRSNDETKYLAKMVSGLSDGKQACPCLGVPPNSKAGEERTGKQDATDTEYGDTPLKELALIRAFNFVFFLAILYNPYFLLDKIFTICA